MEILIAIIQTNSKEIARLILATLCGALIGFDRGLKRRGAGLRTHTLVCIGSTVVMLLSEYMAETYPALIGDITRLGSQVVSGVGFLGVGTIIVNRNKQVRGLTTAAGLWTTACIGLTIGIGYYNLALIATLFVLFALKPLGFLDDYLHEHSTLRDYYIELSENKGVTELLEIVNSLNFRIANLEVKRPEVGLDNTAIMLSIEGHKHAEFIKRVHTLSYLIHLENLS